VGDAVSVVVDVVVPVPVPVPFGLCQKLPQPVRNEAVAKKERLKMLVRRIVMDFTVYPSSFVRGSLSISAEFSKVIPERLAFRSEHVPR
jgi:hypothetical protein